jgi:anti-sigma28 factor (negative regulator of flagellin synthesis)
MRVDDRKPTGAAAAEPGRIHETEKSKRNLGVRTGTPATDNTGDRVELSSTLKAVARAMSAFGSERANRVPALAAQYQSGSYYADSAATANSMVSEALLAEVF